MKYYRHLKLFILLSILLISAPSRATILSELMEKALPEPFVSVSAMHDYHRNVIIIEIKILNIPRELPPVDMYLFVRQADDPQVPAALAPYFLKFNMDVYQDTFDLNQSMEIQATPTPFLTQLNLPDILWGQPDLILPGLPIDGEKIPEIENGRYWVYLVLLDSSSRELLTSTVDLLRTVAFHEQGPDPSVFPCPCPDQNYCDLNQDGWVSETEKQACATAYQIPCDFNNDGTVDDEEQKACQALPMDACDVNNDGIIDDAELKDCQNAFPDPCDVNNDGVVEPYEKETCQYDPNNPCDLDGDGFIDENEKSQCDMAFPKICDCDLNGLPDEQEKAQCLVCDTNGDGQIDAEEEQLCQPCPGGDTTLIVNPDLSLKPPANLLN